MITSKFVWDAFEKYSDNLFYINNKHSLTYGQFFQQLKTVASQFDSDTNTNNFVPLHIDRSLDSLVLLFAHLYNSSTPVLLSKQLSENQSKKLLNSIKTEELFSDEDATIMFSSGSSSIPKAILHTYSNHYYSALGSNENIVLAKNDRWLLSLPMHHIGGLSILFRTLLSGATLVGYDKSFSLENAISKHNITHVSVVPTQLRRMMLFPEKLKSLKAILVGGGMVPDDLIAQAVELNLPIYKTYGMSEMTSQVTTTSSNASAYDLKTSGSLLNYRELKIADDNEILVRGEVLCKKYLNAKISIDNDGWFHTGDLGSFDPHINLNVLGRKDNMFISGGENIYPEPIEKLLMQMEDIIEVCIVPKNSEEYGQVVVLFYKTNDNEELLLTQVKEYLQTKVQLFEIPKEIYKFPDAYQSLGIKLNRTFLKNYINKK